MQVEWLLCVCLKGVGDAFHSDSLRFICILPSVGCNMDDLFDGIDFSAIDAMEKDALILYNPVMS